MFDLIKKLTEAFGVSGNEEDVRQIIINEIKDKVDEIRTDALGNLIAVKKGSGKKIMVAAHMDEIGIMVTHIDEQGFLRFSNIGWVSQYYSLSQRVKFKNGTTGVIFFEEKLEDMKNLKLSSMYIDIGAKSRQEAESKVRIGDVACFEGETVMMGDMLTSRCLDDRCGCAIVIKTIQSLPQTDNEIYFVFTVQEELGLRGAKTATFALSPDMAIAIDITDTGDTPKAHTMAVKCGMGPAIKIKDRSIICHPHVKKILEDAAARNSIPFQYEILESGGSDAGAIHQVGGGVPSGAISIPCRYIHTISETASMSDIANAVKLLTYSIISSL